MILCRFLEFATASLLWGAACLRADAFPADLLRRSARMAVRLGGCAAVLNLAAALGWMAVEAALVGDGPQDAINPQVLAALLVASHFGRVWLLHLVLAVAVLAGSLADRPRVFACLAGLNLGSLALTGHAVMPGGWMGAAHEVLSVLHLLAAGFWAGGLAVILPLLATRRREGAAGPVLRQFSRWGHLAVALVFATGGAKALLILTARGGFDPSGLYLTLLAGKVAAVVGMLGLALVNRYRFVPRLGAADGAAALGALQRATVAELVLVIVVLGLVSVFATLSPFAGA